MFLWKLAPAQLQEKKKTGRSRKDTRKSLRFCLSRCADDDPSLAACFFSIRGRVSGTEFKIELKSFVWRPSEQIDFFANVSATPLLRAAIPVPLWLVAKRTLVFHVLSHCTSSLLKFREVFWFEKPRYLVQNKHRIREKRKEHVEQPFFFFFFFYYCQPSQQVPLLFLFFFFFFFEKESAYKLWIGKRRRDKTPAGSI